LTQKYDAGKPASIAWSQNDSRTPSEIFAPGLLSIKWQAQLLPELRPIRLNACTDSIERLDGRAARIGR
jgi:hypothetical protein